MTIKKFLYLIFLIPITIYSQTGSIIGKVVDASNQSPLPGVNVVVLETTLGAVTDENGEFKIDNVPIGNVKVKASLVGYNTTTKPDVVVAITKPVQVDFNLEESVLEFQGVTVTSDFFQKDVHESNSVTTFSYEEIRRSPGGFEDVIRALSLLPGVAQADAGRNDLIIRGGAPSENLYILDELIIPNINHFGTQGATGGPLSYIDLNFVKETTFSSGGFSALYGDKLSSVLRIDLREGRQDRLGGKAIVSATQFGLNAEGPLGNSTNFLLSARRSYLDFIFKAAGFGFVPEYWDGLLKVNHKFDNHNSLSYLFVSAFDNVKYFNDTPEKRYDNSRVLGSDQTQYATGLNFRHLFDNGLLNINLGRNYVDYNTAQRDSLQNPIFLNISKEGENNLRVDLTYSIAKGSDINIGGTARLIKFNTNVKIPFFQTTFGDTLNITELNAEDRFFKGSGYIQYTGTYFNHIRINPGVRFEYFNAIENNLVVSPRFSLSYIFNNLTSLNFSWGIYHQSPSYIWLIAVPENKNLEFLKTYQYIAGIEHRLQEDLLLRVEAFYKDYHNYPASLLRPYLVLANTGAGFAGSDDNFSSFGLEPLVSLGKGNVKGAELMLQKKSSQMPMYGLASITYSESFFTALDGIKRPGSYDQKWILNLTTGYIFNEKWEASMKFRFSTGKPYTPFENDGTQLVQNYNTLRTVPNHSLDIRVDRRWSFANWNLIAYVDIQNIYNRKNVNFVRWDKKTRAIEQTASIGILPSIGIIAEF